LDGAIFGLRIIQAALRSFQIRTFHQLNSERRRRHSPALHTSVTMIRNAFLKSARYAVIQGARRPRAIGLGASSKIFVPSSRSVPTILLAARCYSAPATLSKSEVEGRIVDLLKNFDKVLLGLHGNVWRRELTSISSGYRPNKGTEQHNKI
jgi:hypothetical protein